MVDQYDFSSKEEIVQTFVVKDGKVFSDHVEIQLAAKGEPGETPQKNRDYFDGEPGIDGRPPVHQWEGTKIRFQNPDGSWGPYVDLKGKEGDPGTTPKKGVDYFDGEPGKTPKKGKDYFDGKNGTTPEKGVDYKDGEDGNPGVEPEEMKEIRELLNRTGEVIKDLKETITIMVERVAKIKDGDPGYTPQKGIDYDDGKDGTTPEKGVDYRDGKDAKIPESATMPVITDVQLINGVLSVKRQDVKFYL